MSPDEITDLEPYIAGVLLIIIIGVSIWANLGVPTW